MSHLIDPNSDTGILRARAAKEAVVSILTSAGAAAALQQSRDYAHSTALVVGRLDEDVCQTSYRELDQLESWIEESWTRTPHWNVTAVERAVFQDASPETRFFRSAVLNGGASRAMACRGIMSAVKSPEVQSAFSSSYGDLVEVKSAKFARFREGDYIRRHSDMVDGRRFGLLIFLSPDWKYDFGGQLVVENPYGEAYTVAPELGTVAILPLLPGFSHIVTRVNRTEWTRYAYTAHFSVTN